MKTQNPLIGRSRKSYGDATFYTLNGQNIVRTKPMVVANPNTLAQEAQRIRFKAFIAAANSLSETELNFLFASKEVGRNRRSMLQAQLAPAYGTQATATPGQKERFDPTFDVTKLDKIGSGEIGYIGDLAVVSCENNKVTLTDEEFTLITSFIVEYNEDDNAFLVCVSNDGCELEVIDCNATFAEISAAITAEESFQVNTKRMTEHGNTCNLYAVGGKLQLIGLGTFSVAERPARKGNNAKHNVPV